MLQGGDTSPLDHGSSEGQSPTRRTGSSEEASAEVFFAMDQAAKFVEALATLIWPVLAAVLVVRLLPVLQELVQSRSFKITIGSFEISAQEAADQLATQIKDLQDKLVALDNRSVASAPLDASERDVSAPEGAEFAPVSGTPRLLWVDDKPRNNAYEISRLSDDGWDVVQAVSTDEAISKYAAGTSFGAVISDMGRTEDGRYVRDAGLQLIRRLRDIDQQVPIFIYSSQHSARTQRTVVLEAGGTNITASPVELLRDITASRAFSG